MIGTGWWRVVSTNTDVLEGDWLKDALIAYNPGTTDTAKWYVRTLTGITEPTHKIKIVFDPDALTSYASVEIWGGTAQSPVKISEKLNWGSISWEAWYPMNSQTGTNVRCNEILYVKIKINNFDTSVFINFQWTSEWLA